MLIKTQRKSRLLFVLLFVSFSVLGQTPQKADNLFQQKEYLEAKKAYEALLRRNPKSALYNYRYARCCYELNDDENAIKYFELAGTKYPLRNKYLGELYMKAYRFSESATAYENYLATLKEKDADYDKVKFALKRAQLAENFIQRVDDISIIDSMIVDKSKFLNFYNFTHELGSLTASPIQLKNRVEEKIVYTTERQDRMYFSDSIRGQMDIFTCYKLLEKWSDPKPVSNQINTSANENYPFLMLDGLTLYFASDGENSIGGYDIFITRYVPSENDFFIPDNIGMPYNSPYNDYMMVIDELHSIGWFATDRFLPEGKVTIFTFVPNEAKKIIQSNNLDSIREVAKLKTFRKVHRVNYQSEKDNEKNIVASEKNFRFIVNDTLIYTDVSQFRSKESLQLWSELNSLNTNLKNKKKQLYELRLQYDQNENKRQELAPKILALEKEIANEENLIDKKTIELRNCEIKFIQNNFH
ncbi:MAG TPA: tetratricopeptide repeat protein [Paludibacteraceae bacterium]|nr:tetratricopeptide repeat protein [Paludibacteraceae bacterium]